MSTPRCVHNLLTSAFPPTSTYKDHRPALQQLSIQRMSHLPRALVGALFQRARKDLEERKELLFFLQVLVSMKLLSGVSLKGQSHHVNASFIRTKTEEAVPFCSVKPLCHHHQHCFPSLSISSCVVSLHPSSAGIQPACAAAAPCILVVYALIRAGGSNLLTSKVALMQAANSF